MVKEILKEHYDLNVISIEKSKAGAGSDVYFSECAEGKFVLKFPFSIEMNDPASEPELCDFLLKNNIRVCEFIKNNSGKYISKDKSGRLFHVQKFVNGKVYDWNTAPDWLLDESAEMLGKIHTALKGYPRLSVGIGADFFRYMTAENALKSYENTILTAKDNGDKDIEKDLLYRIDLMKRFPQYCFDIDRLTCTNTHGDYCINQIICGENQINAVIDWTTACVHPVVWEIIRSYVYAAEECEKGEINVKRLVKYFKSYLSFAKLNIYDIETAADLFYYQIAVCDYYGQYYASSEDNREIYLKQAKFSTKLLKWFEKHIDTLTNILVCDLSNSIV